MISMARFCTHGIAARAIEEPSHACAAGLIKCLARSERRRYERERHANRCDSQFYLHTRVIAGAHGYTQELYWQRKAMDRLETIMKAKHNP